MKPAIKTKLLKISQIVIGAGTQIRAKLDEFTVDEYAAAMLDAANKFPPVTVFHDGTQYILVDGFHRVMAASRNGFLDIEAEIRKGTRSDALKFALGANASHGLKRSNADKRRCVELALTEWPDISDNQLATICAVSHPFVGIVRAQVVTVTSCDPAAKRLGADGKAYKQRTKPASVPIPEPEPAAPEPDPDPIPEPQRNDTKFRDAVGGIDFADVFKAELRLLCSKVPKSGPFGPYMAALQNESALLCNRDRQVKHLGAYTA